MKLAELSDFVLKSALKLGAKDVSAISTRSEHSMVRIANSSVSVVKRMLNIGLVVYLTRDRKRIVGSTSNPTPNAVRKFVSDLFKACGTLPSSRQYAPLPRGPFNYRSPSQYDSRITEHGEKLVDFAKEAVDASLKEGATRVAGALNAHDEQFFISTSGGARGSDHRTRILLNVRAFADSDASGQGLSCASRLDDFDPKEAGVTAGMLAKDAANPGVCEEGRYDLIMNSTVTGSTMNNVGSFASAFIVDAGLSFLANKLGSKVAAEILTLSDVTSSEDSIEGRVFDDEGVATGDKEIIGRGTLVGYLHNSTTAKIFKTKSTGNAGFIEPTPWNLIVEQGEYTLDEMVKEVKRGIYVTNNWYTRFQNYREGEYSTVPRDAAFIIENGEIKRPIAGIRISDTLPRLLLNIHAIGKERSWVKWWDEVATPTLCPALLIKDVPISRAAGVG